MSGGGGGWVVDFTKSLLKSTEVKSLINVGVELGNIRDLIII